MQFRFLWVGYLILNSCTMGNCLLKKEGTNPQVTEKMKEAYMNSDLSKRVKVYKEDGSLQCGQGDTISLEEMASGLRGVPILRSYKSNDGKMRIQVCGAPTGNCNVYEIDQSFFQQALSAGFKQWTVD